LVTIEITKETELDLVTIEITKETKIDLVTIEIMNEIVDSNAKGGQRWKFLLHLRFRRRQK
jgi:hypothetical protein